MNYKSFCQHIARMEQEMSTWDRFKSSPVYLFIRELSVFALCIVMAGVSISFSKDGLIGEQQLKLFFLFVLFPVPLYLAIRFFRDFHLNNPKRKIFFSKRLAALASTLLDANTSVEFYFSKRKPVEFSSDSPTIGPLKAQYTMGLLTNQGGVIPGETAKLPTKLKDTTFYWLLSCETTLPDMHVSFNNREGAPEKLCLNKIQKNVPFAKAEFLSELEIIIHKTILRGELRIRNKHLKLHLYDNVKSIHSLSDYPLCNRTTSNKSDAHNRSFENLYQLLHLFSKGTVPTKEALK